MAERFASLAEQLTWGGAERSDKKKVLPLLAGYLPQPPVFLSPLRTQGLGRLADCEAGLLAAVKRHAARLPEALPSDLEWGRGRTGSMRSQRSERPDLDGTR